MVTLKNVSTGARGILGPIGGITIEAGQQADFDLTDAELADAIATGWFAPADPLDHDADGEKGGSLPKRPPALTGKSKAELLEIASVEAPEADETMTITQIKAAIESARGDE